MSTFRDYLTNIRGKKEGIIRNATQTQTVTPEYAKSIDIIVDLSGIIMEFTSALKEIEVAVRSNSPIDLKPLHDKLNNALNIIRIELEKLNVPLPR